MKPDKIEVESSAVVASRPAYDLLAKCACDLREAGYSPAQVAHVMFVFALGMGVKHDGAVHWFGALVHEATRLNAAIVATADQRRH